MCLFNVLMEGKVSEELLFGPVCVVLLSKINCHSKKEQVLRAAFSPQMDNDIFCNKKYIELTEPVKWLSDLLVWIHSVLLQLIKV